MHGGLYEARGCHYRIALGGCGGCGGAAPKGCTRRPLLPHGDLLVFATPFATLYYTLSNTWDYSSSLLLRGSSSEWLTYCKGSEEHGIHTDRHCIEYYILLFITCIYPAVYKFLFFYLCR